MTQLSDEQLEEHRTRIASMYAFAAREAPSLGTIAFGENVVPVFAHIAAQAEEINALKAERDKWKHALGLSCDETRENWMESAGILGCERALNAERQLSAIKGRLEEEKLSNFLWDEMCPGIRKTEQDVKQFGEAARAIISHVLESKHD
jgi:hypothetical protein